MNAYITRGEALKGARPVAVEDMILVRGMPATAGSYMLSNYEPLFDAEAVTRLRGAGYAIAGKANVGEFSLDLLGETSYKGPCVDEAGRLGGASALLVRSGEVECALNLDVNGAPRRAAALAGVAFIKPTYGTVSRYGAIPCVCSSEQIGVTAGTLASASACLEAIAGHDEKDGTSASRAADLSVTDVHRFKAFVPEDYLNNIDGETRARMLEAERALLAEGAKVERGALPVARAAHAAWYTLLCAETCNNLSRYDGVKFGRRAAEYGNIKELYQKSRSEGFGPLAKSVILYGSDVLSKDRYDECYDKALRIRRVVYEALTTLLLEFDAIMLPACSKAAYEENGQSRVYEESLFTSLASITGFPAAVAGGLQFIAKPFCEGKAISAAMCLERSAQNGV